MEIDLAKIDPKHLKVSYLPVKGEMSRRDLIFGLLKPHYEIVPAVEKERCTAWRGCTLCVASCPQEAISLKEGSASIDKDKCTACGACLHSCPGEAISSPLLNPEVLDDSLQSLLCRDEIAPGPKVLLITSEGSDTLLKTEGKSLPPQLLELKLPCTGALSPWLLLRSLDLGAAGIAVIPCPSACRHRCRPERWQRVIKFVQALLVQLGIEQERVRVFSLPMEDHQALNDSLQSFIEQLKEMGPTSLRNGNGKERVFNLVALLKSLSRRFNVDGNSLSGDEIPFGIVTVKTGDRTCTLCGACPDRCPTGAITLQEGTDSSKLVFDHSRCIACEACVRVCPEQVLRMERALEFSRLGETTILAQDQMAHCRRCGKEIAPLKMVLKIQDQLGGKKVSPSVDLGEFCPDCRIFCSLGSDQRGKARFFTAQKSN